MTFSFFRNAFAHCLILCLFVGQQMHAQLPDKRWGFGISGGTNQYNGDLGNRLFAFDQAAYGYGGIMVSRWLNPSWNITGQGSYGAYGYSRPQQAFAGQKIDFDLLFTLKLNNGIFLPVKSKIQPFLSAGFGTAGYRGSRILPVYREGYKVNDLIVPIAAGIRYQIDPRFAIQYQFIYKLTDHDVRDRYLKVQDVNGRQDHYGQQMLSLVFQFGSLRKDYDNDGVPDKRDRCPYTPSGVPVDSLGCPFDRDKDGVYDYADLCPDLAGDRTASGCPDKDGDGVADAQDQCPDTFGYAKGCPDDDGDEIPNHLDACPDVPGIAKMQGCPDSDDDGIPDHLDACPQKAGSEAHKGCPDTDGDGIPDPEDECPGIKGTVKGCPDRDEDGIADVHDRCPDKSGLPENKGCPGLSNDAQKILQAAVQGVQFESNRDILKPVSFPLLEDVYRLLQMHPESTLFLEGHTDSSGDAVENIDLSYRRAEAVKQWLMKKGISEARIETEGFGDEMPIDTNDTPEGRSRNRRVEFRLGIE